MRFLIVLAAAFLVAVPAVGWAVSDCSELPPTSVTVTLLESEIQTNFQRSYVALKGMSSRYADYDLAVLGLTVGKALARTRVTSRSLRDRSGQWECATYQIAVEIGYQPITVFVGREFPEGSCAFKGIYAHEMRHATTYRDHARRIVPEISQTLRERFDSAEPMRGVAGTTQSRLQAELDQRWMPYIKRLLESVETLQRDIDTRDEYDRVAASCNGEIKRIMARGRN